MTNAFELSNKVVYVTVLAEGLILHSQGYVSTVTLCDVQYELVPFDSYRRRDGLEHPYPCVRV